MAVLWRVHKVAKLKVLSVVMQVLSCMVRVTDGVLLRDGLVPIRLVQVNLPSHLHLTNLKILGFVLEEFTPLFIFPWVWRGT